MLVTGTHTQKKSVYYIYIYVCSCYKTFLYFQMNMIKQSIRINFEVKTFSYTLIFIYIHNPKEIKPKNTIKMQLNVVGELRS